MGSEEHRDGLFSGFYTSGWDPVASSYHNGSFLLKSSVVPQNNQFSSSHYQTIGGSSSVQFVHGSEHFSDMVSSFGAMEHYQSSCPQSQKQGTGVSGSLEAGRNSDDGGLGSSPNSRRKRRAAEVEQLKDSTMEIDDGENRIRSNSRGKQAKGNSIGGENAKENYVHVRAKRGQATNSHSLAERVRREKISERMKFLQELVPGCNKITGKAVMLDEIINYVQSLQQQVEFLSMKLATVNPEINMDIERVLSNEIVHPQGNNGNNLGIGSELRFPRSFQLTTAGSPPTNPPFHQNLWSSELQSVLLRTRFDSANQSSNSFGTHGLP